MNVDRRPTVRYLAPVLTVALAFTVRLAWADVFGETTFLPMFVAVLFCAWLGGLVPGTLATALSAAGSAFWLFAPLYSLSVASAQHRLQLILFVALSMAVVVACESLHRERRRAQALRGDIDELEAAQRQLRALAADLSEADRRKDEFLATLAHELRNPLAPLRNSLEALSLAGDAPLRRSMRQTMERQLAHLVRLVDDLLDVGRISRDRLSLRHERVELHALVHDVVAPMQPLFDEKGHTIEVALPDAPVELQADRVRLAQVLGNLLHNACKFTPPGGRIRLEASLREDVLQLSVGDNGIGIAPERQAEAFEMFRQLDASLARTNGGLGIGLGLARRLVELHGGTLELHSDGVGHGTTVTVCLPAAAPSAPATPPGAAATPGPVAPPRRVLVADDNRDSADSMAMILQMLGHEVRVARDGIEALATAEAFRPQLLLLDIGMPGLNGYEVCRRVRDTEWGRQAQVVAVSGWGESRDRALSHEAGFDAHRVKPIEPEELQRLLRERVAHAS